jgi:LPPG:FO 2-phospho-L-lactate transferase
VTVLAGGFGGARMAHGFALLGDAVELSVIVNTGDDLELHGLCVSPDLDTVMYTLAGLANVKTGWGVRDETWSADSMLARYGRETWFRIGDRDLATHIARTARLRAGERLTDVTRDLARAVGVSARLLPMTDAPVRTKVLTADGWTDFQDYFVRRGHRDDVLNVRFDGIEDARPTPGVLAAIKSADLLVIAPSNPFVSVAPILALPGVSDAITEASSPVVAVSPIVGSKALRGPAAQMLAAFGWSQSSAGVAAYYARTYPGLIDAFYVDRTDETESNAIAAERVVPRFSQIVIEAEEDRRRLALELLDLAQV